MNSYMVCTALHLQFGIQGSRDDQTGRMRITLRVPLFQIFTNIFIVLVWKVRGWKAVTVNIRLTGSVSFSALSVALIYMKLS